MAKGNVPSHEFQVVVSMATWIRILDGTTRGECAAFFPSSFINIGKILSLVNPISAKKCNLLIVGKRNYFHSSDSAQILTNVSRFPFVGLSQPAMLFKSNYLQSLPRYAQRSCHPKVAESVLGDALYPSVFLQPFSGYLGHVPPKCWYPTLW